MNSKDEINILNLQIVASFLFIITTIISIIITYNEKYYLKYKIKIISDKLNDDITKFNRLTIAILLIVFVYINYKNKQLDKNKGKNSISDDLEILASYFSLIAGLIVLYVTFKYNENSLTLTENPII